MASKHFELECQYEKMVPALGVTRERSKEMGRTTQIIAAVSLAVLALLIGILIGNYGIGGRQMSEHERHKLQVAERLTVPSYEKNDKVSKHVIKDVKPENIKKYLKYLSKKPHVAGTARDFELAKYIQNLWSNQGLDKVEMVPYNILLSYPDPQHPNTVEIVDSNSGEVFFTAQLQEKKVPQAGGEDMGVAFNGFSPSGNVTGEPVYVNYGRVEDFDELEALGVNVSGKICLSRYGKIFRGNKVWNAQQRGAVGVILYLDPVEVALEGTDPEHVYPKTWWMPETAMQRGSVFTGDGDPLTPGYPSVEGAYRYAMKDTLLPKIPSQPIGYGDARNILSLLSGQPAPTNWSGGFNITLHLGPGFAGDDSDKRIRLQVYNKFNQTVNYNVIGYIRGDIEPDRYVILGNHRDAWGFGAVDPSSGTAEMLEVSRILGKLHKNGWKPRRTLVFCSWAAEEYGLIGSTEWVEDKLPQLMDRTVAYVNSDVCASGTKFQVAASPLLASVVQEMTRYVEDPGSPEKSVYDTWKDYHSDGMGDEKEPRVRTLSSGSDHSPFAFYAGIPSIDISWVVDKKIYPIATYPAYHTAYETFDLMSRLIDPKFIYHQSCSRLNGLLLHRLSGSLLLPYNLTTYGEELQMAFHSLEEKGILEKLEDQGISLGLLKETIDNFTKTATEWHKHTKETDLDNPLMVRQVNDQMMLVERTFIKPTGLPEQPLKRNIAFAPSKYDSYSSHGFPAIHDLSYGIDNLSDEDKHARWEEIKLHISDLTVALRQAKAVLDRNFYL